MDSRFSQWQPALFALVVCMASGARGEDYTTAPANDAAGSQPASLEAVARQVLPPVASDGLYLKLWGWGSYLNVSRGEQRSNGDGQLSLDVTKSFGGRVAITAEVSMLAANDHWRGQLEQGFVSLLPVPDSQMILTIGKFHAGIGAEGRDFWERFGGTTSLLFSAEPQDLVGGMLTLPVGETHLTIKPFLTTDFEGRANVDGGPSGGVKLEYHPLPELTLAVTNWAGPGFQVEDDDDEEDAADEYGGAGPVENWRGPEIHGERAGTVYFVNGAAVWKPRNDLTLAGEVLSGTTSGAEGGSGWQGCMLLANFDVTDQWRLFGRWSFLNDSGLITGTAQRRHELSAGVSYSPNSYLEVRGEYRHDFSNATGDLDSLSLHLVFGF